MFDVFSSFKNFAEDNKINVLFPEYPGYSIYESQSSTKKSLDDSLIIYDYILKHIKNITEKNIYILGRSLGTGLAVYLSYLRNPAGVFLISPYTTFAEVRKDRHTKEFYKDLSNYFRSIDYIDKVKCPLLIIHGKKDNLIDYHEANKLYEKYNGKNKEIKLIEEMGHNDVYNFDLEKYIIDFVNKYCPLDNTENDEENKFNFDVKEIYTPSKKIKNKINSIEYIDYYFRDFY
jgi:esterase/lipase